MEKLEAIKETFLLGIYWKSEIAHQIKNKNLRWGISDNRM